MITDLGLDGTDNDFNRPSATGPSLHRFPGTSCLATINLSLRDKAILPSKGHTIILAFMGLQPGLMLLALRARMALLS
jgi:hypothetical protein